MSQLRLEALRESLLVAGVAPRHVHRYLGELRQHFEDLLRSEIDNGLSGEAALRAARARLGGDDGLAKAMLARPELRALAVRAPWLVFGLTPIFLSLTTIALVLLLVVSTGWLGGMIHQMNLGVASPWLRLLWRMAVFTANFLEPPLAASLLAVIAARQRMPLPWPLIGIAVITVCGLHMDADFPAPDATGGSIGLSFPMMPAVDLLQGHAFHVQWLFFLGQLGLALLPVLWLLARRWRRAPLLNA